MMLYKKNIKKVSFSYDVNIRFRTILEPFFTILNHFEPQNYIFFIRNETIK